MSKRRPNTSKVSRMEMLYVNRHRVMASPTDGLIMLRAVIRLECANKGHAWGDKGRCERCGAVNPEIAALVAKTVTTLGTGRKEETHDDASPTVAP